MTDINVSGLKELQAFLMRGALRSGCKPILEQAKSNVPVKSGELRDTLRISSSIKKQDGKVTASVKAGGKYRGKDAYYARWIEYTGAQPHSITGRLFVNGGVYTRVSHPGFSAKPFMRPALDTRANDAVMAAGEYIKKRLSTKHGLDTSDITIGLEDEN
jgi:HK97 gp10 family phage protein